MCTQSNNELNDLFDYGYMIYQNSNYFKFSIDSLLLAEFVEIKRNHKKVLDLCSGNAPVPLILNKKYGNKISIVGVELQREIYNLGVESILYNKVKNISLINEDVLLFASNHKEKYDVITCNPPYFKKNDLKNINDNEIKAIARHEIAINLEQIIQVASKLINNKGYFYLVHRAERLSEIMFLLKKYKFGLKKLQTVYNDSESDCCFIIVEAIYNGEDYVKIGKPLFLKEYKSYQDIFRG